MKQTAPVAPWRAPWLSTALAVLAFAADRFHWDLAYERDRILQGELHRLVTGHFAHFNRAHLLGDALAFAFWAACVEQRQRGRAFLAWTIGVTTLGSSLLFLAFRPDVLEYRGLSAVDCALAAQLIALGAVSRFRARDVRGAGLFAVAGVVFAGKTAFEFATGHAVLAPHLGTEVALLPVAHVAGILMGLAVLGADRAFVEYLGKRHGSSPEESPSCVSAWEPSPSRVPSPASR